MFNKFICVAGLTTAQPYPILRVRRDVRRSLKGTIMKKKRANSVVTHAHDADAQTITFAVAGEAALVLNLTQLSDEVAERAFVHGMVQRISDAAAMSRDPTTGKPATPADKRARMAALVEHYESGTADWNLKRAAGNGPGEGLTIRAMGDVFHKLAEECRDMVKALAAKRSITEREALAVFASSTEIAKRIAELRAERAAEAGISADDILAEIG